MKNPKKQKTNSIGTLRNAPVSCNKPIQLDLIEAGNTKSVLDFQSLERSSAKHEPPTAVCGDRLPAKVDRSIQKISVTSNSLNARYLYSFQDYLKESRSLDSKTIDEYLRSASKLCSIANDKAFNEFTVEDVKVCKSNLISALEDENNSGSESTCIRTLRHWRVLFEWLERRPEIKFEVDIPGYFNAPRHLERIASQAVKGTEIDFRQATRIFECMSNSTPIEIRNKAIIATFLMTGIRCEALSTLQGSHVDCESYWIYQTPPVVRTKHDKMIRSFCIDILSGVREALKDWSELREKLDFGKNDAFFLPDKYLRPNT